MRAKIEGHTDTVNSVEIVNGAEEFSGNQDGCLLSASDDGTARIWDLRTNKGVVLLKHEGQEVVKAKYMYGAKGVLTATGTAINLFDLRKPSLVVQSTASIDKHQDEVNDIDLFDMSVATQNKFWVGSCDDTGALLVHEMNLGETRFEVENTWTCNTKHSSICYKTIASVSADQPLP